MKSQGLTNVLYFPKGKGNYRRANWSQFSTCTILQQMVDDTKVEAYQRGITAQIYGSNISQSITSRCALLQKVSKKVIYSALFVVHIPYTSYHSLCASFKKF